MNILITGSAGYIGSHIVKKLGEETSYNITALDNLSTGNRDAVLYGNFIQADLSDLITLEKLFQEKSFDAVIHLSASIEVHESVKNPLKYYINNTVNTINLINLCVKYNVNKFIFSSTAAVYGETEKTPVLETSPLCPINPYGWSKVMSEKIIQDTPKTHGSFKYIILRYFNVAGASRDGKIGQSYPNATHLIKVAAETALGKRECIHIFGDNFDTPDGTGIRDYIHIEDISDVHIKAIEYLENNDSDIFNCGYGYGYSVKEVINTMKEVSGVDFKVKITDKRPGDPAAVISDNQKILKKFNWIPKYNNLEIICKTAFEWEKNLMRQKELNRNHAPELSVN